MARYEVRVIASNYQDGAGQLIQPLGNLILATDDAAEATRTANSQAGAYYYGLAILDTQERTVDWGDATTEMHSDEYGRVVLA